MTLAELYQNHDGYVSDKWSTYLSVYERLLSPMRDAPISLLEIGVQNGGSIQIWGKYFPNCKQIVGCDINPDCAKLAFAPPQISVVVGDIKEPETQLGVAAISPTFDIIIDDGSHTSSDIIKTFCALFPRINQNGLFIVEDLHCSYWDDWEGGLNVPASSMEFFKCLTDLVNFEHWQSDFSRSALLETFDISSEIGEAVLAEIHSIEFVNSMCIITRRSAQENTLGPRSVVGVEQPVCAVKHTHGSICETPTRGEDCLSEANNLKQLQKSLEAQLVRIQSRLEILSNS
jgi:hypothetical protein